MMFDFDMDQIRLKFSIALGGDRAKLIQRLRPQPTSEYYRLQRYFRDPADILGQAPFSERFISAMKTWFFVMLREKYGAPLSVLVFGCPPFTNEPFPFYEFLDIRKPAWKDVAHNLLAAVKAYNSYQPMAALNEIALVISRLLGCPASDL